jgi:hypothetical protein
MHRQQGTGSSLLRCSPGVGRVDTELLDVLQGTGCLRLGLVPVEAELFHCIILAAGCGVSSWDIGIPLFQSALYSANVIGYHVSPVSVWIQPVPIQ